MLTRLVLVECLDLERDDEGGHRLRRLARVVEALTAVCPWVDTVRPGVCTFPLKGPTRYFGSEEAVLARVEEIVGAALQADAPSDVRVGVAEGVFAAALAARAGVVVPAAQTPRFLEPWPVRELGDADLAEILTRLGLSTLGCFAAVPVADVLARFGAAGAHLHRVARAEEGELPGYRVPGMDARLAAAVWKGLSLAEHQPGFWGGTSEADERAAEALRTLQRRVGPEAVSVPVLGGGRSPAERCRLVAWRPDGAPIAEAHGPVVHDGPKRKGRRGSEVPPWPGRLPDPSPARVLATDVPAEVVDATGTPVAVSPRGLLSAPPARLSAGGGPWATLVGWSAPWPVEERWWSRRPGTGGRRRAARLQVLTDGGRAYLLRSESGRWRVEAAYD